MKSRLLFTYLIMGLLAACARPAAPTQPVSIATSAPAGTPIAPTPSRDQSPAWFQNAVVYEIVPRSFYDSNGDGIGDLGGITRRLDYIQALGANTILITSVLSSTSLSGFDVTDYSAIARDLGSRDDLAKLAQQAHSRKMHVLMDLPLAFTSNQFPPFRAAYGKADSEYADWFQWQNSAHTVYKSYGNNRARPLLNYAIPAVQEYLGAAAQDWLRLGLDGFRLPDASAVPVEFWQSFRQSVKQVHPGAVLLGSAWESDPKKLAAHAQDGFDALMNVPAYYALAGSPDRTGGGLLNGRTSSAALDAALAPQLYGPAVQAVQFLGTNNANRIASTVGQDPGRKRMAAILLLTLPGTPSIYYGDEIGMVGTLGTGAQAEVYRWLPMDWTKSGKGAGVPTWFKDAARFSKPDDGISVEEQQNVKTSLWSLYQQFIAQRLAHGALRGNNLQSLDSSCKTCYAYLRWDADDLYFIAFNFSDQTQSVTFDLAKTPRALTGPGEDVFEGGRINLPSDGRLTLTITAWEARLLHWGK